MLVDRSAAGNLLSIDRLDFPPFVLHQVHEIDREARHAMNVGLSTLVVNKPDSAYFSAAVTAAEKGSYRLRALRPALLLLRSPLLGRVQHKRHKKLFKYPELNHGTASHGIADQKVGRTHSC